MINASELRIGNLVFYEGEMQTIKGIFKDEVAVRYQNGDLFFCQDKNVFPVELTEELLLRFGFEKREHLGDFFIKINHYGAILIINGRTTKICNQNSQSVYLYDTEYAHQLQNLYFAITGQELTLKNNQQ